MSEPREVEFTPEAIVFHAYPFPGARVHPAGAVPWGDVREVDPARAPPELRIDGGEALFVDARRTDDLLRAAAAHGIPTVHRADVWDMLLDPFLDTTFSEADQERTLARLEHNGVPRHEAARIRERVAERMLQYNALLWDWVHLGMWDLLHAHLPGALERAVHGDARFRELYRWAQEIAQRARIDEYATRRAVPPDAPAGGEPPADG